MEKQSGHRIEFFPKTNTFQTAGGIEDYGGISH